MAPDATNVKLLAMDRQRREYVSGICGQFITEYLLQIEKFHCKGGPGRKILVGEVVIIHDDHTKRVMWTIEVVKELITSRNGLIRSVIVKTPNGNLIDHAIQSLHPLELREDQPDDVVVPPTLELELKPENQLNPCPLQIQSSRRALDHGFWWGLCWEYTVFPTSDNAAGRRT
ncbi:Uncharacterized protein APZ42_030146 [Daphnia magna]|uniref:DUF5641 domain-containing protein n=1 Tax=Daphnia magna TaxID=35525 RepID=A0A164P0T2_9CRUS|nr:Uncharacterized protein APZ42_030146 [Daphnia magna]